MASYSRKPNYHFKDKNSTGIDKVPAGRQIIIEDYDGDGSGKIKKFVKKGGAAASITSTTTMEEILNSDAVEGSGDLENSVMSKAQFEAMAEMRRNQFAGSGFVEFGSNEVYTQVVNEGMAGYTTTLRLGRTGKPKVNVNGNLLLLDKINDTNWPKISFPEAPDAFVISDSSNLPQAMKQGDFAILRNFDRNLVKNGDFTDNIDGWGIRDGYECTIEFEDGAQKISYTNQYDITFTVIDTIPGVEYSINTTVNSGKGVRLLASSDIGGCNSDHYGITGRTDENLPAKFIAKTTKTAIGVGFDYKNNTLEEDDFTIFDNVIVKQISETPIVALQDIEANIDIYENSDKFQARDSVSRQDLVFLESWHEDVSEKGIVYPFGNVQYRGADTDGLSGISNGSFTGAGTYSLFGNWQNENDLVGKGYIWNNMSEQDKVKFVGNPDNNIYADGDKYIQVRYRIRVVKGLGNDWENADPQLNTHLRYNSASRIWVTVKGKDIITPFDLGDPSIGSQHYIFTTSTSTSNSLNGVYENDNRGSTFLSYNTKIYALPIALVQRRNKGAFHPVYNPEGCRVLGASTETESPFILNSASNRINLYADNNGLLTSLTSCFQNYLGWNDEIPQDGKAYIYENSGSIGLSNGRPDELTYNEINERDVQDLRMNAKRIEYKKIFDLGNADMVANRIRGKEVIKKLKYTPAQTNKYAKYWGVIDDDHIVLHNLTPIKGVLNYKSSSQWLPTQETVVGFRFDNVDYIGVPVEQQELDFFHIKLYIPGHGLSGAKWQTSAQGYYIGKSDIENNYVFNGKMTYCDIIGNPKNYPSEWLEHGITGIPTILDNRGNLLTPDSLGVNYASKAMQILLPRKFNKLYMVLVQKKDGTWVKYNPGGYSHELCLETGSSSFNINSRNTVWFNIEQSYETMGYDDAADFINNFVALIYSEVHTRYTEISDKDLEVLHLDESVQASARYDLQLGGNVTDNMIHKVTTANSYKLDYTVLGKLENFRLEPWNTNNIDNSYLQPEHSSKLFEFKASPSIAASKFLGTLVKYQNKAYLNVFFKELRWGTEGTDIVYFDTGFANNQYDISGVDGEIIIDGLENHKSLIYGGPEGVKKYLEIYLDNYEVGGTIEIYIADHTDEDLWQKISGNVDEHVVFFSGREARLRYEFTTNYIGRLKIVHNSGETVYVEQVRLIKATDANEQVNTYNDGYWGDDNKFQIVDGVLIQDDDNNNKILYGVKRVELPYFID